MCLSREEQDSMRALAGTAGETVELSQTLYNAVMARSDSSNPNIEPVIVAALEEPPTRRALKSAPVPQFTAEELTGAGTKD